MRSVLISLPLHDRIDFICDYIQGKTVLDIGFKGIPKTAEYTKRIQASASSWFGIDPNCEDSTTTTRGDIQDVVGRLQPRGYEVGILGEVIEHCPNPLEAVKLSLIPCEKLIVTTPNALCWKNIKTLTETQTEELHHEHIVSWTPATFIHFLNQVGHPWELYGYISPKNQPWLAEPKGVFCNGFIAIITN